MWGEPETDTKVNFAPRIVICFFCVEITSQDVTSHFRSRFSDIALSLAPKVLQRSCWCSWMRSANEIACNEETKCQQSWNKAAVALRSEKLEWFIFLFREYVVSAKPFHRAAFLFFISDYQVHAWRIGSSVECFIDCWGPESRVNRGSTTTNLANEH